MTFQKIIVPLDGSARAERALTWARKLSPEAQLILLHVIEPAYSVNPASLVVKAEQYLSRASRDLPTSAQKLARVGSPTGTILDVAEETRADLIAMTTLGGAQPAHCAIGRVAEKILHGSDTPVLVVPTAAESKIPERIRKVLVPLDGSEISAMIVPLAKRIAEAAKAEMIFEHVAVESPELIWKALEGQLQKEAPFYKALLEAVEQLEQGLEKQAKEHHARLVFARGTLPDEIVKTVKSEGIDLIVMSCHGYGAIGRKLLGSTASRLIQASPVPVLVAKQGALKRKIAVEKTAARQKL